MKFHVSQGLEQSTAGERGSRRKHCRLVEMHIGIGVDHVPSLGPSAWHVVAAAEARYPVGHERKVATD